MQICLTRLRKELEEQISMARIAAKEQAWSRADSLEHLLLCRSYRARESHQVTRPKMRQLGSKVSALAPVGSASETRTSAAPALFKRRTSRP